jgi:hypothetical protein
VSKPSGPTFEACFIDGTTTRMTTHCPNGKLDLGRAVRLARAAWGTRKKARARKAERNRILMNGLPEPPPIATGRFVERNADGADTVLKTYTTDELNAVPAGSDDAVPQG